MIVHDDVLLAIFDAPTDQIVEVGWQPRYTDAIDALVGLLQF